MPRDSSDGAQPHDGDDDSTRIIRRAPLSGPLNTSSEPHTWGHPPLAGDIIRRHPTGEFPAALPEPPTGIVDTPDLPADSPRAEPVAAGPRPAIAAAVASILSGWATAVIATDLITGWWATDLLFCIAIGFLATISAAATISGLIALLLRRRSGRLLVVVGSVIALLIFASLFVAGASLPGPVYAMPVLPLASIVLAALPSTARWSRSGSPTAW